MTLSCFLRSSFNLCRVSGLSSGGIALKARPLTSLASLNMNQIADQRRVLAPTLPVKPMGLLNKVQSFSTTSVVAASGVPDQHDHSKIWALERILSIALMPALPLGVMFPNILFDLIISAALVMHIHWGVEAFVVDYVRPIIFGKLISKLAVGLVYVFSVFMLIGLLNLTFRGQGVGNSINTIWSL